MLFLEPLVELSVDDAAKAPRAAKGARPAETPNDNPWCWWAIVAGIVAVSDLCATRL